jgi:hypothetical protein
LIARRRLVAACAEVAFENEQIRKVYTTILRKVGAALITNPRRTLAKMSL